MGIVISRTRNAFIDIPKTLSLVHQKKQNSAPTMSADSAKRDLTSVSSGMEEQIQITLKRRVLTTC